MKKNGFTLVELLAIIVLIGVLSGIIIVKVIPSINESEYSVGIASTDSLVGAMEKYYFEIKMRQSFSGCSYNFSSNLNTCDGFSFSGEKPTGGSLTLDANGHINGTINFDDYSYEVINNKVVLNSNDN